jgi:lipoyl(octanoyl) transferase
MKPAWLITPDEPVPYAQANAVMHHLADLRSEGEIPDTLILLEHTPVYTAGRRSESDHLVWEEDRIRGAGADYVEADRGGSVTFHGPGQLVGYPILDLGRRPDLTGHISRMEEAIIRTGKQVGVDLDRDPIQAGVWSGRAKVCAIGVRLAKWRITLHGFGLNCDTDLSWFDAIVPCGLPDRTATSLSELAGRVVSPSEIRPIVAGHAAEVFELDLQPAPSPVRDLLLVSQGAM